MLVLISVLCMHTQQVNILCWLCAGGCQCDCGGLEWWRRQLDVLASGGKHQGNWSGGYQVSNSANHTDFRKYMKKVDTPIIYLHKIYKIKNTVQCET